MKRAWLSVLLLSCATGGAKPDKLEASVTELVLQFDEGKGDLRFTLHTPGIHEPAEIHWQLRLDDKALASGVAVAQPQSEEVSLAVPVKLKGVRFDEGARRVRLSLSGDATVIGTLLSSPLTFSTQKELVLVGAPIP